MTRTAEIVASIDFSVEMPPQVFAFAMIVRQLRLQSYRAYVRKQLRGALRSGRTFGRRPAGRAVGKAEARKRSSPIRAAIPDAGGGRETWRTAKHTLGAACALRPAREASPLLAMKTATRHNCRLARRALVLPCSSRPPGSAPKEQGAETGERTAPDAESEWKKQTWKS